MALDFDGIDDVIAHGDISDLRTPTEITVSFWFNENALELNNGCVSKRTAATNGWGVQSVSVSDDMGMFFGTAVQQNFGRIPNSIVAGQWAHFAFVYDGSQATNATRLKGYLNGAVQTLSFTNTIPAVPVTSTANVLIGRSFDGAGGVFTAGKFAHIKVWTAVLTDAEIQNEYLSRRPRHSAGLVLWVPLDDPSGTDYSGNGNHGTVTEAVLAASSAPLSYGGE